MFRTSRPRVAAAATASFAALLLATVPAARAESPRDGGPADASAKPYLDVRTPATRPAEAPGAAPLRTLSRSDAAARRRLVARLGGETVLNADPITATPRMLGRLDGTLTGPRAGDPATVAMGYVDDNAAALGLAPSDLGTLKLADRTTVDGVTYVSWRQEVGGVPVLDNGLRAAVDVDGRVVNVTGAPRHDLAGTAVTPALAPAQARDAVARDVGVDRPATIKDGPAGPRQETTFSTGDHAALVLFGGASGVRLAWQVTYKASSAAWYDAVVDAVTGAVLRRANMVDSLTAPVFHNYPGAPVGGTQTGEDLNPYLTGGAAATTLNGPNAHAWSDLNDDNAASAGEDVDPSALTATDLTFQSFNGTNGAGNCDATHPCSWDAGVPSSWDTNRKQNAVQAFWYVNHFHDHLAAPPIGFDAASGAFDGADALDVRTDDGANLNAGFPNPQHIDNANMVTPPDGQRPTMQMFLFVNSGQASPFRDVNGGDDAAVVYHEYTHGLSNRLIKDLSGAGALDLAQPAAMGEAWSDWYAKDLVVKENPGIDTAADGEVDMGAYVDTAHQIRTQAIDCSVGSTAAGCPHGGYTYANFAGLDAASQPIAQHDPHAASEIWGETLWDIRKLIGSQVAEALITAGMRLSPIEPSFLDERDVILQADQTLFGGIHVNTLWGVFANRGMGFAASTAGPDDAAPHADFTLPPPPANMAGGGAVVPAPAPAGGATPVAVPASAVSPAQALSKPTARVTRSTARGRATFTVGCSSACRATATLTVSRATARFAGLGRTTRLARVTRRLTAQGRRTFGLNLPASARRRARAAGLLTMGVTVTVSIRDSRGQTGTLRRALRIRIR
jgi:extracellular elastinolytic metalloproteinase